MFKRLLNLLPVLPRLMALVLGMTLSVLCQSAASGLVEADTLMLDRAVLSSMAGVRPVALPHRLEAEDFPAKGGRVRYRLEFALQTLGYEPLGIFIPKLSLSGQLSLNGVIVGACGLGALENLRCLHQPQLFVPPPSLWRLGPNTVEFEIFANDRQMNGLSTVRIGPAYALYEGPYLQAWVWQVELLRAMSWIAACLGSLALLVGWILRSEKIYLWFGLCGVVNALSNLNVLISTPLVDFELFSWFVFSARMITAPLCLGSLLAFFKRLTPGIEQALLWCAVLIPLIIGLGGSGRTLVVILYVPMLVALLMVLLAMIRWSWRSRRAAEIAVSGLTLGVMGTSILDWLRLRGQSAFEGVYGITYVFTGFMLMFGLMLMVRLASSLIAERKLSVRLGLVTRAAQAGFWEWDLATGQITWNPAMLSLFGFDPSLASTGLEAWTAWQARVHPEDLAKVESVALAAIQQQQPLSLDYRIVRPDGEVRWVETRADILRNPLGEATSLSSISLDVTVRKQAEIELDRYRGELEERVRHRTAELQEAMRQVAAKEHEMRHILENLPIPISVVDINAGGTFTFLNHAFASSFCYALEEMPSLPEWLKASVVDDDGRSGVTGLLQRAQQGADVGEPLSLSQECKILCKDQSERHVLLKDLLLEGRHIMSWIDLTELRQVEAELKTVRGRLERTAFELTENIPIGTFRMVLSAGASTGRMSFLSSRFLELLGLERDGLAEDPMETLRFLHSDDVPKWKGLYAQAFAQRQPFIAEGRVVDGGTLRWVSAESVVRNLPDGSTAWEGILADVSAQKEAKALVQAAHGQLMVVEREQARQAERQHLLQEMHDGFGSQLATARLLMGQGQMTQGECTQLLGECLDDLRLLADTLSTTESTLDKALANYRYRCQNRLAQVPVRIDWHVGLAGLSPLSERIILQIMRILQEALGNALRHAQAGQIGIDVRCRSDGGLALAVTDDGIGLPETITYGRGLAHMESRAHSIGARLELIRLTPGTRIALTLPLKSG